MQKLFSLLYNAHPLYQKCLDQRQIPDWIDYEIITKRVLTEESTNFMYDTDIERLYHLQQNPNAWYLDADVEIIKWPDFEIEPGYPYMSCPSNWYDSWCILGNGCQSFFDNLMNIYHESKGSPRQWWSHKLFNNALKNKIRPLPEGYFKHLYFGRDKLAEKYKESMVVA